MNNDNKVEVAIAGMNCWASYTTVCEDNEDVSSGLIMITIITKRFLCYRLELFAYFCIIRKKTTHYEALSRLCRPLV